MWKTMVWSNWPEAKEENKNTESEVMADKKTENRNIDTAKARGELEEDLLEYVYRKWRQGRQITSKEYARTTGITTSEVLFLYKKYPVNSVLESKKTVAEGLWKKNSPEKNFANAHSMSFKRETGKKKLIKHLEYQISNADEASLKEYRVNLRHL